MRAACALSYGVPVSEDRITIDELAAQSGVTTRNIRSYQSRGLLQPPTLRGRTGYYGPRHLERLSQIRTLQRDGLNLEAIRRIVTDSAMMRTVLGSFADSDPYEVDAVELLARLGAGDDDGTTERAVALGLVEPAGRGTLRVLLPTVVSVAEELAHMGLPLSVQLDAVEVLADASGKVAEIGLDENTIATLAEASGVAGGASTEELEDFVRRLRSVVVAAVDVLVSSAISERISAMTET